MREGGQVSLPAMRRGLSPEGRRIRERHSQGSISIGVQGVTVHPTERGRSQNSFLQENVRRLREIQARCRERDVPGRRHQPLKATRESSATTSSSSGNLVDGSPGAADGPLRKPSSRGMAEREDSPHSDYYSLSEEPPDPPPSNHPHCSTDAAQMWYGNSLPSPSSRPQSPVMLKPLNTSLSQSPAGGQFTLPDAGLTREMRRLRMENLVSRISSQRPACEMDYNQHYRTIENQHRLLLDSIDRNSSCGSGEGSGGSGDSARAGGQGGLSSRYSSPKKMVRAHSFDRSNLSRRDGSVERNPKVGATGERKASRNSSSFPSPQQGRRFSKSTKKSSSSPNTAAGNQLTGKECMNRTVSRVSKLADRGECGLQTGGDLDRANTNADSPNNRLNHLNPCPSSSEGAQWMNTNKLDYHESTKLALDATSLNGDTNLNSPFSSSCDFYPAGQEDSQSPNYEPHEDLRLLIHSDSQNSTNETEDQIHNTTESNWDSTINDLQFPQNSIMDTSQQSISKNNNVEHHVTESEGNDSENCDHLGATREEGFNSLDARGDRQNDSPKSRDEERDGRQTPALAISTPVPNARRDNSTTTTTIASPKLLKKRDQQHKYPQSRNSKVTPLRRSQSLKNVNHLPGEPPPSYQRGKLPRYLQARLEDQRRQEELARAVDPDCPPGHQPLPDHERRNTLHLLHKSQTEVLRELSCLPVAQDTLRVKKARHELEEKLTQIEEGLRIFSQTKVYIMNDE